MADSTAQTKPRPVSGIPVPINKRQSFSLSTALSRSNSSNGHTPGSRSASPVALAGPPGGRSSPHGIRRQSLINASSSRKTSFTEGGSSVQTDDPNHLKAQIAMLQSSLAASHQRIVALTADMNLGSSTPSSPQPFTPTKDYADLLATDGMTPLSAIGAIGEEEYGSGDGTRELAVESSRQRQAISPPTLKPDKSMMPRLPHSNSSYDLRSSAITPAKSPTGTTRKTNDGPLGLGRIPQSAVAQALVLHTSTPNGSPQVIKHPASQTRSTSSPTPSPDHTHLRSPFIGSEPPHTPSHQSDGRLSPGPRRVSGGSVASTRVIDGLQTELINSKGHNEKLKQEIRSNQRLIGSLTRQNEDLKETKERMRIECEGLNNVIARKERLLQEVLERARAAESALAEHQSTRKALEQSTKKSLQQMTSQLSDAQASQHKAEREANSLRDSVKSLKDVWARELKGVKEDMRNAQEKGKVDLDKARLIHTALVKQVEAQAAERTTIQSLAEESVANAKKANTMFDAHIANLKGQLSKSEEDASQARAIATELAAELGHLRRLMREPRRASLDEAAAAKPTPTGVS